MQKTIRGFAVALGVLSFLPLAAPAAAGDAPPRILREGTPDRTVREAGTVTVKVLVRPSGKAVVKGVVRSSNPHLNAAALAMARGSTYAAARKDGAPIASFYDYVLRFTVAGEGAGAGVGRYDALIRTGDYEGAKNGLAAYLGKHPGDVRALTLLGVAETFLSDYPAATTAFDRAGSIAPTYRTIAGKAYAENAVALTSAKNYRDALTFAGKAVALTPSFATYNTLGFAQLQSGDPNAALPNFSVARTDSVRDGADPKQRALIAANLADAYVALKNLDQARAYADEAVSLDPSAIQGREAVADAYAASAHDAAAVGKADDAAALYEKAAAIAPTRAVTMYGLAASGYLNAKPKPLAAKARAEAEKALAIDAGDPQANLAEGVALADAGRKRDAQPYLARADAQAKAKNLPALQANVESVMKQLGFLKR